MTYRYESDQPIPVNVLAAIRFTGKVGFLSKELWHGFFGVGNERWKKRQLQFVIGRGYFKKHRNEFAKRIFVLTTRSKELLKEMEAPSVSPVPVMYLAHDSVVARSMLELSNACLIDSFTVERELKTYGLKDFLLSNKDHDQKYPDAVFKIDAFGGSRTVALEYERERKSLTRYKSTLWSYAGLRNLSMVLFICENPGIQKAIESAMKHLGQTGLTDRLAFVNADDWKKSPLDAPIHLKSQTVKLREICTPITNSGSRIT